MEIIVFTKVESSNVVAVGWKDETLFVEYSGHSFYSYSNVPEDEYLSLLIAPSKGRYMNGIIKPKYDYTKCIADNIAAFYLCGEQNF